MKLPRINMWSPPEENTELDEQLSACLIPLLDSLGWKGDQLQVHEAMPKTNKHINLGSFLNTMANMHYESISARLSPKEMPEDILPCFFLSDNNRAYVVIKKIGDEHMVFNGEEKEYQHRSFKKERGTMLRFFPMRKEQSNLLQRQTNWFLKLSMRFTPMIFLGLGMSLVLSVLALASPLFVMSVYGQLQVAGAVPPLVMIGVGILLFILSELAFRTLRGGIFNYISERMSYLLSTQVLRRILMLPPAMTETSSTQSQISRIKEFENISRFFNGPAINGIFDLITSFFLLGGMIWIGGSIAYIPAIAIIIAIVFAIFIRSLISRTTTESARADSKRQELLFEMLNLYRFIKTTGVGPPMMNQYEQLSLEANMSNLEMTRMHTLVSTFGQGLSQFSGVCTMIFGVLLVMEGTLDSGTLLATMLITWKILAPVRNIFTVITSVDKTIKSIFQLDRFMNLPQELQPEAATHFSHQFKGDIVFTNVSMKSPAEVQASLMGTSFSVKRGQILQICCHGGVDGAAILDALLRMRDYQSGSISIDAMNIRQFDPITIRRSIAYVPDTIELFETTLLNNLLLAHPTATEDEIHRALDLARLTRELRKLPLGLNTPVDGRDDQFSESFLKRLGFARAWIRPSEINIYQSPDIGLTQSRILELAKNLGNFKSTTTTIVVSNNAELFKKADIGLWLDQGKVKSYGPAAQVSKSFYEAS